ncbi:MAG: phage late control D family protein, partial [Anaerolineae bacterium]
MVEPAVALTAQRWGSRVFQDRSVPEIVAAVLAEHRAHPLIGACFALEDRLTGPYPRRSYCLQYRESDLAFLDRLLGEEGIRTTYRFDTTGDIPRHTLILFDDEAQ